MTEIVVNIISISILHIEILISLGHWMILRDMGYHMNAFCFLTGLFYQDKPVIIYFRPLRSNAMQITSFRKEFTAHGIGRDDNLGFLIMLQEIP